MLIVARPFALATADTDDGVDQHTERLRIVSPMTDFTGQ